MSGFEKFRLDHQPGAFDFDPATVVMPPVTSSATPPVAPMQPQMPVQPPHVYMPQGLVPARAPELPLPVHRPNTLTKVKRAGLGMIMLIAAVELLDDPVMSAVDQARNKVASVIAVPQATAQPAPENLPKEQQSAAPTASKPAAVPSAAAPKAAASAGLSQQQQRQLELFVPQGIACTDPVASLQVNSKANVNFLLKDGSGVVNVLKYVMNSSEQQVPRVEIDDALDVQVCGSRDQVQKAVSVDTRQGVITVDPSGLTIPTYRKASAGVASAATMVPAAPYWARMKRPADLPGYIPLSIARVNASLADFAHVNSARRPLAFRTHQVLALEQIDNNVNCAAVVREAVVKRLREVVTRQATGQGVEKFKIHISDRDSLRNAYIKGRRLRSDQYTPLKGGSYSMPRAVTSCSSLKGGRP